MHLMIILWKISRRNITTKITAPDTLRRYGITIDYEKNDNQFIRTHISCLEELDGSCSYCLSYYSDVIDKLSISFNNQLLDNNEEAENTEELDINDDSDSDNEDEINIDNKENTNIENELTQSINAFVKSFNVDLSTNNIASSSSN